MKYKKNEIRTNTNQNFFLISINQNAKFEINDNNNHKYQR